jgi:hypothetical protein
MLRAMLARSRLRPGASGGVLLAFVGLWLGHTAEYARVYGTAGLRPVLAGSVHAYMVPLGLLLLVLAAAGGARCWQLWTELGLRLDRARGAIAAAWRSHRPNRLPAPARAVPSAPARVAALWLPVAVLQTGLYLIQENVEAVVAGRPAPGFGAVSGAHWAAPLVHAGVALLLAAVIVALLGLVRRRARHVAACEALLRVVLRRLQRPVSETIAAAVWIAAPLQLFGRQLWRRPPPFRLSA